MTFSTSHKRPRNSVKAPGRYRGTKSDLSGGDWTRRLACRSAPFNEECARGAKNFRERSRAAARTGELSFGSRILTLGSARVSRVGFGVSPKRFFLKTKLQT